MSYYYFFRDRSAYDWKPVIFVFLSLAYLINMVIAGSIYFPAKNIISFFFTAEYYSIVCLHCIFFIHSSVPIHFQRDDKIFPRALPGKVFLLPLRTSQDIHRHMPDIGMPFFSSAKYKTLPESLVLEHEAVVRET
jgi:hypothetical protein